MESIKRTISFICVAVVLTGCGFKDYNTAVQQDNQARVKAFGEAMSKQTTEGGRLAVAIIFATGMGQIPLAKPETAATYIPLVSSVVSPFIPLFYGGNRHKTTTSDLKAGRDIFYYGARTDAHINGPETTTIGDKNKIKLRKTDEPKKVKIPFKGTQDEG